MVTATIDKSVLLSNLEVQRCDLEHVHQRKEKERNETVWSLFAATEALRDILVDGARRTWGELSPKQVTALWIGAASSIGAVGLGLDVDERPRVRARREALHRFWNVRRRRRLG